MSEMIFLAVGTVGIAVLIGAGAWFSECKACGGCECGARCVNAPSGHISPCQPHEHE